MPAFVRRRFVIVRAVIVCLTLLLAAAAFLPAQAQTIVQQTPAQQNAARQGDLQLYRLESIERRMESSEKSGERLLIIAVVLAMLMLAVLLTGAWRAYMRWHSDRLNATARNARRLMRDIRAELERPQLAHLRTGYALRRIMRIMRKRGAILNTDDAKLLAECGASIDMPASLYLTARALLAEANGEWYLTAKWLEVLTMGDAEDDIDVLLHLAHIHIKLAAAEDDKTARGRHLQISRQYYARFAEVVPADDRDMPMPPEPQLPPQPPKEDKIAESLMAKVQQAPKETEQELPPKTPPPQAQTESPPANVSLPPKEQAAESSLPKPQPSPQKPVDELSPKIQVQAAGQVADMPKPQMPPQVQPADVSLSKPQPSQQKPISESSTPDAKLPPKGEEVVQTLSSPKMLPKSPVIASTPVSKAQPADVSLPPKEQAAESSLPNPQPSPQKPISELSPKPQVQAAGQVADMPKPQVPPQAKPADVSLPPKEQAAESSLPKPQPSPQKPIDESPPKPQPSQQKPISESSTPDAKLPPKSPVVASTPPPKREYESAPPVWFASAKEIAKADREQPREIIKRAAAGARNVTKDGYALLLNALRGGGLPLMPLVPILPPPAGVKDAKKMMWDDIARGNGQMYRAALALSVRSRNRYLDSAVTYYAGAQRYHTNEYLCQNAGLAHIAKALHSTAQKRQAHFRMAAGMYAAGNAVRPHYFDFSLAVLYALADDAEQCRKWLRQSAADKDTLRSPVFDNMRGHQWFAEFAG